MTLMTVKEIAAYLGVTEQAVRNVVMRKGVRRKGSRWKAALYDPNDILQHTGHDDRLRDR